MLLFRLLFIAQSIAQIREDMYEELTPPDPEPLIHDDDLERLQLRLLGLFEAELLTEEEFLQLEDLAADFAELQSTAPGGLVTRDCASELQRLSRFQQAFALQFDMWLTLPWVLLSIRRYSWPSSCWGCTETCGCGVIRQVG